MAERVGAVSSRPNRGRLSRYEVKRAIGKGSYGEVFLVTYRGDGKQYVMKNIKLTASSAKERHAAEQEASLLSRLKHPNIVSYRESFQDTHCVLHIVMGYCEGGDLSSRLKSYHGNLLPETQVVEWFVQIALALQYLHDKNILHRDLKTQNIFLSKNDIIKVGDLGIARVLDGSCDLARTVVGTPYYMSPELFSDQPYNHKSDIWALGCCVYEMATLKHAFSARNINALMIKIVQGQAPVLPLQFSSELSDIVKSMLSREASKRPSVHQLLRNQYVRTHIKMFLDRASDRRKRKQTTEPSGREHSSKCTKSHSSPAVNRSKGGQEKPPRAPPSTPLITHASPAEMRISSANEVTLLPQPFITPSSGLSSARERRREHRKEVGKRRQAVLRTRSSSNLLHNIGSSSSSDSTPTHSPNPSASSCSTERQGLREGIEDTDGPAALTSTDSTSKERACDGGGNGLVCVSGSSSSLEEADGGVEGTENGEGDMEEVYTLLDSTLHMEGKAEELDDCSGKQEGGEEGKVLASLRPGRLKERIFALRRECEARLGKDLVATTLSSLSYLDPEADPVRLSTVAGASSREGLASLSPPSPSYILQDMQLLIPLLGDHNHQTFAPKLRQLWLCEDALGV